MSNEADKKRVILINANWFQELSSGPSEEMQLSGHSVQILVAFGVNPAALGILDCEDTSDGAVTLPESHGARPRVTPPAPILYS